MFSIKSHDFLKFGILIVLLLEKFHEGLVLEERIGWIFLEHFSGSLDLLTIWYSFGLNTYPKFEFQENWLTGNAILLK